MALEFICEAHVMGGESYFQCSFNVNHFFFSLRWSASVHFGVCVGNECVTIFWSMVSVLGSGWGSFSPNLPKS